MKYHTLRWGREFSQRDSVLKRALNIFFVLFCFFFQAVKKIYVYLNQIGPMDAMFFAAQVQEREVLLVNTGKVGDTLKCWFGKK